MLVDQSPEGVEVLRGSSTYTYDGNWKVQAENGADGYHVSAVHWNYAATTSRRNTGESANSTKALDAGGWGKSGGGYWSYPNGHLCLWTYAANPEDRPLYARMEELKKEFGDAKGEFMVKGSRNLCLYPNVYLMDQFSTQIRHFRPIAPDKTEVTIYCIAPKARAPRPGRPASASTRTSSTPPAWPLPTTWRSSAPASSPTRPPPPRGTT